MSGSESRAQLKECDNIYVVAFLSDRGVDFKDYGIKRKNLVVCYYELSDEEWRRWKLEYSKSEFSKVEQAVKKVMSLGY